MGKEAVAEREKLHLTQASIKPSTDSKCKLRSTTELDFGTYRPTKIDSCSKRPRTF